jgi:hypothetical protein
MNAIETAFVIVIVLLLAAAAYAGVRSALRLLRHDGRLRLSEAVQGQGLVLPEPETGPGVRAQAMATRRCMTCAEQARCDKLLEAHDWNTLREICPNTAYIDSLRRPEA